MKTALLTGIRELAIRDVPEPALDAEDRVLLRIDAVGVCGSDIHYYTQGGIGRQRIAFPATIGHECAGTVVAAGSAAGLKAGERVAIDPLVPCGVCDQCRSGRVHTCRNQRFLGCPGEAPGALAELLVMPSRCCFPVPASMTMAEAAMVEPLSIGVYAIRLAGRLDEGAKIAILGSGPIGLCVLLSALAVAPSCKAYVTDLVNDRLAVARRCGAEWTGNPREAPVVEEITRREPLGMDFVFECAGEQETLDQAVELLKPGGTLLIVGIPETDRVSFPIHQLRRKEITVRNVRRQNECTADAVRWIAEGRVHVRPLMTHHFRLAQSKAAFDMVAARADGVVKAIIELP